MQMAKPAALLCRKSICIWLTIQNWPANAKDIAIGLVIVK
jgi:hypothetical protein